MLVYVNNQAVNIFKGCTAADAVRRLIADTGNPISYNKLYDAWGNVIATDSPMNEGRRIYTAPPASTD